MVTKQEVKDQIELDRKRAEKDLAFFIQLVHPDRMLGHVHRELISWWTRPTAKSHQLVLLPRDHMKSALVAYRVAWEITRNPAIRIIYMSATSNLANKQLGFIKQILLSANYRRYWPQMVNENATERTKWTETEIQVDDPRRAKENIRDSTVSTAGLTTVIVGLHCDVIVLDDVVIDDNARTKEGRNEVKERVSYFASIGGTDSQVWAVGTRYHPEDLYSTMLEAQYENWDEDGEEIGKEDLYEVFERQVEDRGDGTGNFLWPRMQRPDGKWFGFDMKVLSKKKAQYFDLSKFRAQYYNNPNNEEDSVLKRELFQYYDKKFLSQSYGNWYFKDKRLNVYAAIDMAYSTKKNADYTALVVAGIDSHNNVYILDIERFKTDNVTEYFDKILKTYVKWGYRKIRTETGSSAQAPIIKSLKEDYIRPHGLALSIDDQKAPRNKSKEERMEAALYPKYTNMKMWHYLGGNCELLEEELVQVRPRHDDIKDALACVMEIMVPPVNSSTQQMKTKSVGNVVYNSRFGGLG